jgi:hypothetical protein
MSRPRRNSILRNLSGEERERVEQFTVDYNKIDRQLRNKLSKDDCVGFTKLVNEGHQKGLLDSTDAEKLRAFAKLRNFLTHETTDHYLAIPSPLVVRQIGRIRDRIFHPERAIPKFQKEVETITVNHSLATVLRLIAQRDYS